MKMTSCCLQGLSPFLLANSSTTCNLEMQCSTPKHIEELPEGTTTLMLKHKKASLTGKTEVFFMVVKDVDSVMSCGAVELAQMLKGEKHFANTIACNIGLSSQSHCSHFQIYIYIYIYIYI